MLDYSGYGLHTMAHNVSANNTHTTNFQSQYNNGLVQVGFNVTGMIPTNDGSTNYQSHEFNSPNFLPVMEYLGHENWGNNQGPVVQLPESFQYLPLGNIMSTPVPQQPPQVYGTPRPMSSAPPQNYAPPQPYGPPMPMPTPPQNYGQPRPMPGPPQNDASSQPYGPPMPMPTLPENYGQPRPMPGPPQNDAYPRPISGPPTNFAPPQQYRQPMPMPPMVNGNGYPTRPFPTQRWAA